MVVTNCRRIDNKAADANSPPAVPDVRHLHQPRARAHGAVAGIGCSVTEREMRTKPRVGLEPTVPVVPSTC